MSLNIPFFDSPSNPVDQDTHEKREILRKYFRSIPDPIQGVIRKVLLADSALMAYELGVSNVSEVLHQRNILSQEFVMKLSERMGIGELSEYASQASETYGNLVIRIITGGPLRAVPHCTESDGCIVAQASTSLNRYHIIPEDLPKVFLYEKNLTALGLKSNVRAEIRQILGRYGVGVVHGMHHTIYDDNLSRSDGNGDWSYFSAK